MKKIFIIMLIILLPKVVLANWENIGSLEITIQNKKFSWNELQQNLEKIINKTFNNNIEKKIKIYKWMSIKLWNINKNNDTNILNIKKIVDNSLVKSEKELEIDNNKVKKTILWYSSKWAPIFAYYKWDPEKWFFWIFSNIHGWYEYWTYETAIFLEKELEKSWVSWWFIIPTINPEWLEYYKNANQKYDAYIEWRVNSKNVDLNRNFCTKNFEIKTFIKNWLDVKTAINWCNSESETKVIIETLKKFKFNKIISLHSKWNILFIPDNSIDDKNVINFWYEISKILPNYKYDISFSDDSSKKQKIKEYEINEWWDAEYTGTMETYIYENYRIPIILIELPEHWKIEYKLKDLKNIIN